MSNLRTYLGQSRKRSRKDKGSQARADSPTTPDTDTEPEEVASSAGRPTRTLEPQATLQRNIQPMQHISDDARKRAELASRIGVRCAITHTAATKGDDINDKYKVQLMHIVERSSEEDPIRFLEYILGKVADSISVDSSSNLMYGVRALHEPFDATGNTWGLCPPHDILKKVADYYAQFSDSELYDAAGILEFWNGEDFQGPLAFSFIPFGNFNEVITRELLDDRHVPTGGQITFIAPYGNLIVDSHLSVPFVLWNLIEKVATQDPSELCNETQLTLLATVEKIGNAWRSMTPPTSFYNPLVPLLEQPALMAGTDSEEENLVHRLRTRKVISQVAQADDLERTNCQSTSIDNSVAGKKRKSRKAKSTATGSASAASSAPRKERPLKSRPARTAPSQSGKE